MKIKDIINLNEIGFASAIPPPNFLSLVSQGQLVGHIDNEDVFILKGPDYEIFFFKLNNQISSYVIVGTLMTNGYRDLIRMHNINAPKGSITALIMFLKKEGIKLRISDSEPLTYEGLVWLGKLIDTPRGLKITDQNGNQIDKRKLNSEWLDAHQNNTDGPTSIYIEGVAYKHELIEKWNGKDFLRPAYRYLYDSYLD